MPKRRSGHLENDDDDHNPTTITQPVRTFVANALTRGVTGATQRMAMLEFVTAGAREDIITPCAMVSDVNETKQRTSVNKDDVMVQALIDGLRRLDLVNQRMDKGRSVDDDDIQ